LVYGVDMCTKINGATYLLLLNTTLESAAELG